MSYHAYNPEIESHYLAHLIQFGSQYGETGALVSESDFSLVHRPIFSVIRQQLEAVPSQPLTTVILADKLKAYGVDASKLSGVEPYDYIWALSVKPVKENEGVGLRDQLKLLTVRRELVEKCREAEKALKDTPAEKFDQMVGIVDRTLSSVRTEFYTSNDTLNLFEGMVEKIEEEGNNPLDDEQAGFLGPFPSINDTIGSMTYPGALVVVGARTSVGKSSLSWFYNTCVAEKNNLVSLTLDAAEMTPDELQYRQVCALSGGKIPYWALQNRQWRRNAQWVDMIRNDIWPRIKKMEKTGVYYKNIGTMSPKDIISYIKRFYYNKVGRGRFLSVNFDYFKGLETMNKTNEHQAIGNFVNDLKSLITEEITASIWGSVQNNRSGIMTKDNINEEEHAGQMGLSDRIIQQATHGFILRFKTPQEIALEGNKFGNMKLVCVKKRRLMGRRYEEMLYPVKMPDGKLVNNYFNLESRGFSYLDKGSLRDMVEKTGQGVISVDADGTKSVTI